MSENLEQGIVAVDKQEAAAAVRRAANEGMFRFPLSPEAQGRILDDVHLELPALSKASDTFIEIMRDGAQGWDEDQVQLLGTGFEMALIVIHELVRENRRSR